MEVTAMEIQATTTIMVNTANTILARDIDSNSVLSSHYQKRNVTFIQYEGLKIRGICVGLLKKSHRL